MVSKRYSLLVAKKDKKNSLNWLPLWVHLRDTCEVMKRLVVCWVPKSVIKASGLDDEQFKMVAVFIAAIHDIGKATSYFQNIICEGQPDWVEEINESGLKVVNNYLHRGKTPHAYSGEWIIQSDEVGIEINQSIGIVIGAHHGKPISEKIGENDLIKIYPTCFYGELDKEIKKNWINIWEEIIKDALDISDIKSLKDLPELTIEAQVILSGLLITADWIASNTDFFPLIDRYGEINEVEYPARVSVGWKKCRFSEGWIPEVGFMDEYIFEERFRFYPNDVQKELLNIANNCNNPGIIILEAQMGCGKTEAALSVSEIIAKKKGDSGIFFGLPTQATSNGIYGRLLEWAMNVSEDTENSIKLAHGGAVFNREYMKLVETGKALVYDDLNEDCDAGIMAHPWFQGNKRALLSDFVIGTVDQFLMVALKRKHFMMRHLGLAGKVVIIDECHAYDAYMNQYLDCTLEWMARYGVTVILLSATLPVKRRQEIVDTYMKSYRKKHGIKRLKREDTEKEKWRKNIGYPLITWSDGIEVNQRIIYQDIKNKNVSIDYLNIDLLSEKITEKLSYGGCACIIANTVINAQKYYKMIKNSVKDVEVVLYHAQYTMPDRAAREEYILKKIGKKSKNTDRNRVIVIGTQVLEQSLDYDVDIMFTELCPMDLLLQRIGRLHRHDRNSVLENYSRPRKLIIPQLYILKSSDDVGDYYNRGSRSVYGDYLLMRTKQVLPNLVKIPIDIPGLVNKVYNFEDDLGLEQNSGYIKAKEESKVFVGTKKAKAEIFLLNIPKFQKNIEGILDNSSQIIEKNVDSAVRDCGFSFEVLLMKEKNNKVVFVNNSIEEIDKNEIPPNEIAYEIAKQRIRLPSIFSSPWMIDKVINELEDKQNELKAWQESSWLQGELILVLDINGKTNLCGYTLTYNPENGLSYYKEGGEGIE